MSGLYFQEGGLFRFLLPFAERAEEGGKPSLIPLTIKRRFTEPGGGCRRLIFRTANSGPVRLKIRVANRCVAWELDGKNPWDKFPERALREAMTTPGLAVGDRTGHGVGADARLLHAL